MFFDCTPLVIGFVGLSSSWLCLSTLRCKRLRKLVFAATAYLSTSVAPAWE